MIFYTGSKARMREIHPMRKSAKSCAGLLALFTASVAVAQPLYKSVDAQGKVTFSDSPVPNAVEVQEVQVQPGPSEAEQQEGTERVKRMESQANDLGAANTERAQQRKQAQDQHTGKQASETDAQPATGTNNGYSYPKRPLYPPVVKPPMRPEHPLVPGGSGRPVQLPAVPITPPGQ